MINQPDHTQDTDRPTDAELVESLLQMQCHMANTDEEIEALADALDKEPETLPDSLRDPRRMLDYVYARLREESGEPAPAGQTAITRIADPARDAVKQEIAKVKLVFRLVFGASDAVLQPLVAQLGSDTSRATNETRRWILPSKDAEATGLMYVELTRQERTQGPRYLARVVSVTSAKPPNSINITLVGSADARSVRTALAISETEAIVWSLAPAWNELRVELDVEPGT